jgi:hypothetical protein
MKRKNSLSHLHVLSSPAKSLRRAPGIRPRGECRLLAHVTTLSERGTPLRFVEVVVSRASFAYHYISTPTTTRMANEDLEEQIKVLRENMRAMGDRMRAAEERTTAAEERMRAMEKRMGATPSHSCKFDTFFKIRTNSACRVAASSRFFRGVARVQGVVQLHGDNGRCAPQWESVPSV